MALDDTPTDETLLLLSVIHDLQVNSNQVIGNIQAFQNNEIQITANQLIKLLIAAKDQLKAQNKVLLNLVESQLTLDDRLRAIVATME